MRSSRTTIPGLDGLRGLAAAGILALHVWLYTGARVHADGVLDAAMHELRVGVTLFFVLSAYLLCGPWIDGGVPSARVFWVRRAARILPAFWIAVLAAFWVSRGTFVDPGAGALWWFAVFGYNQVEGLVPLNPPLWSLAVEVSFYALLPLLGLWLARLGRPLALSALLVGASLAWCAATVHLGLDVRAIRALPTFLGTFGCGIAAAALARRQHFPGLPLAGAGVALVVANGVWHGSGAWHEAAVVLRDLPAAAGFSMLVVAVAQRPAGVLDRAPLRALGTLSYGVYVYHWPILFWLRDTRRLPEDMLAGLALLGTLTLLVALASYVLVERPAVRLARSATQRRASASAFDSIAT